MKRTPIVLQGSRAEAEHLRAILDEFGTDSTVHLAEPQEPDEAKWLRRRQRQADRWYARVSVALAAPPVPRRRKARERRE